MAWAWHWACPGCLGWPCWLTAHLATFGVQQRGVIAPASSLRGPGCVHLVSALPGHERWARIAPAAQGGFGLRVLVRGSGHRMIVSGCSLQGLSTPSPTSDLVLGVVYRKASAFSWHIWYPTLWFSTLPPQEEDFPGSPRVGLNQAHRRCFRWWLSLSADCIRGTMRALTAYYLINPRRYLERKYIVSSPFLQA